MNEVQEHLDSLALYGSEAGDAACPACGHPRAIHGVYGCHEGDAVVFTEEIVALRRKAALFDWLVQMIESTELPWERRTALTIQTAEPKYIVDRDTLIEAIEKVMKAEGGDR